MKTLKRTSSAWKFSAFVITGFLFANFSCFAERIDAMWEAEIEANAQKTISEIIDSAVKKESTGSDRPLPLISSWEYGFCDRMGPKNWGFNDSPNVYNEGWFSPGFQMRMIREGHHLLPSLLMPTGSTDQWESHKAYYVPALLELKKNGLPFSLISTAWEKSLSTDEKYAKLPPEENPRVVTPEGKILDKLDPFGPTKLWYDVGKSLTESAGMVKMQELYPNPPRVIFVSNNECGLLMWKDIEQSKRYLEKFGSGKFDDFKRYAIAQAWKEKYRALQSGMRDGLKSPAWKKTALFIGYSSAAPFAAIGRWPNWADYSIHSQQDIVPQAEMWDGASPSYYLHAFRAITDHTLESPQVESMNLVEALRAIYKINPGFWFELSVWDGDLPPGRKRTSKIQQFRNSGQVWDENRYRGFAQFGLWLLRPRVLREYRVEYRDQNLTKMETEFRSLAFAVDALYRSDILKDFWLNGKLVPNPDGENPYQANLPRKMREWDRWFLLDVDINPENPSSLTTNIPVFALALRKGENPKRKWLIYAHSPLKARSGVKVTLPDYGEVTMDVSTAGNFVVVDEETRSSAPVKL